jgi:hypothetical protein
VVGSREQGRTVRKPLGEDSLFAINFLMARREALQDPKVQALLREFHDVKPEMPGRSMLRRV